MPQSNQRINEFSLRDDLTHYYSRSVATYRPPVSKEFPEGSAVAAQVLEVHGPNEDITFIVRLLKKGSKAFTNNIPVRGDQLDFTLPPLGLVNMGGDGWFLLNRAPARRMRKGYNEETINYISVEDYHEGPEVSPMDPSVIHQIWYGNDNRVTNNLVVWRKGVYYMTDKVATIDDQGNLILIPNKEKLGEFACKILASNWESVKSKHSDLTLPSSVPMPLA